MTKSLDTLITRIAGFYAARPDFTPKRAKRGRTIAQRFSRRFARIAPEDRETAKKIFLSYISKERAERKPSKGVRIEKPAKKSDEKVRRARTEEEQYAERSFYDFFKSYLGFYIQASEDREKLGLFNRGLLYILDEVSTDRTASSVLARFGSILEIPNDAISLWLQSLSHLSRRAKGGARTYDEKIERYAEISTRHLVDFEDSYRHVLRVLAQGEPVFGAEDFLFRFAGNKKRDEADVLGCYNTLKEVDSRLRPEVERVRAKASRVKNNSAFLASVDEKTYRLIKAGKGREYHQLATSLLNHLVGMAFGHRRLERELSLLEGVVNANPELIEDVSRRLKTLEFSDLNVPAYLKVVTHLQAMQGLTPQDREKYMDISVELFQDYNYWNRQSNPQTVRRKCLGVIDKLSSLEEDKRKTALDLVYSLKDRVKRHPRLSQQPPLYLDKAIEVITESVAVDSFKAVAFVNQVINYQDSPRGEKDAKG
ncbi:hypothetical protein FJZ19_01100 [Candidatus Pacearchaeota archaeon]|nr:hypothetical protein [Candidatus Pacearchaeota archaeon]